MNPTLHSILFYTGAVLIPLIAAAVVMVCIEGRHDFWCNYVKVIAGLAIVVAAMTTSATLLYAIAWLISHA